MVKPVAIAGSAQDDVGRDQLEENALATAAVSDTLERRVRLTLHAWLVDAATEITIGERRIQIVAGQVRVSSHVELSSRTLSTSNSDAFSKRSAPPPDSILNVGYSIQIVQNGVSGGRLLTKSRPERLKCERKGKDN